MLYLRSLYVTAFLYFKAFFLIHTQYWQNSYYMFYFMTESKVTKWWTGKIQKERPWFQILSHRCHHQRA